MMHTEQHRVPNGAGWILSLVRCWDGERLDRTLRPVLIVPGYAMNSFIFSYHPSGPSLEGFLAAAGFEVWRVDLRAQGDSSCAGGSEDFGMADLALTDLRVAIEAVLQKTATGAAAVDVLGASLGGTLVLIYAALAARPQLGSIVVMGSPIRWVKTHPLMRILFASPFVAGLVKLRGTRRLAEALLPLLARHTPWVLRFYLNPEITDASAARQMVRTVEDPRRRINRQIACWMRDRDLIIRGANIAEGLKRVTQPLLCVLANGDGIVPRETAAFVFEQVASSSKRTLEVGTPEMHHAHADLFVSTGAQERVFKPIAEWLKGQVV